MTSLESTINEVISKMPAIFSRGNIILTNPVVSDYFYTCKATSKRAFLALGSPFEPQIHKAQYKYIGRDMLLWMFGPDSPDNSLLKRLGHGPLNKTRFQKFDKKLKQREARQVLLAFYSRKTQVGWWAVFRAMTGSLATAQDEDKFKYRLCHLLWGARYPEGTPSLPMEFRTTTVIGILQGIRQTEDFHRMPILADALQDAGYDQEDVLKRLRDPESIFSLGDWLFKTTGILEMYDDSRGAGCNMEIPPEGDQRT